MAYKHEIREARMMEGVEILISGIVRSLLFKRSCTMLRSVAGKQRLNP